MILIWTAICLAFTTLLRGVLGFATATLAVPILIDMGYSLSQCVALLLSLSLVQSMGAAYQLRDQIPWRRVRQATVWRFMGLPFGCLLLFYLEQFDPCVIKACVGVFILLAVGAQRCGSHLTKYLAGRFPQASFLSGVFLGAFGSGGPPIVLYTVSQGWDPKQSRAFYFGLSIFAVPVSLALLVATLGTEAFQFIAQGFAYSPIVLLCSWYGVKLGSRFKRDSLNSLAISVLCLGAFASIMKLL